MDEAKLLERITYNPKIFGGKPIVREGGVAILCHPTPWAFHPVHHPSYIDFFEEVLSSTTDPVEIEKTYEERFARGEDPEPLDKDFVRRYYTGLGYRGDGPPPPLPDEVRIGAAKRYIEAYEAITWEPFVADASPPLPRLRKNLSLGGA